MKTWTDFGLEFPDQFTGERYSTCPQCSEKRTKKKVKCLSANGEKFAWICHHCGWSGTLAEGEVYKSEHIKQAPKEYHKPDYKPNFSKIPPPFAKWFKERGISEDTLARNKIAVQSVYIPQVEDFVQSIRFPFFRNGEVVNVKSRDLNKNFRLETNAERIFYGMDDVTGDTAIVVEGEIDKLSLDEAGFKNCLSVPDGAPSPTSKNYTSKFVYLKNCEELLAKLKTIIIAVDNDEPGKVLQEELARRLGKYRCKRIHWPQGCKDANDVLVKYGKLELASRVEQAEYYPIEGIFEVSDFEDQIDALYDQKGPGRGESTGWTSLDRHYTVRPGEMTIVTGVPGHGKSENLDAIAVNLGLTNDWRFAIFSPENQPLERHFAKIAEKIIGKPFFEGVTPRMNRNELGRAKRIVRRYFSFIKPREDQLTVDGILELAKLVILRKGVTGLIIDPWNEIDHIRPASMTETEYISSALTKIRRFARDYSLHIWLVAHPTKLKKDDSGNYPVPTPYDISGSAAWRNKADNCISVYRHLDSNAVEIHVQKIRFKEVGQLGMVTLYYDHVTGRYRENPDIKATSGDTSVPCADLSAGGMERGPDCLFDDVEELYDLDESDLS